MPSKKVNSDNTPIYMPETIKVILRLNCSNCHRLLHKEVKQIKKRYTLNDFKTELKKSFNRPEFDNRRICPVCPSFESYESHSIPLRGHNTTNYEELVVKKRPITD